jgi:hypothetical protein
VTPIPRARGTPHPPAPSPPQGQGEDARGSLRRKAPAPYGGRGLGEGVRTSAAGLGWLGPPAHEQPDESHRAEQERLEDGEDDDAHGGVEEELLGEEAD